MYRKKAVVPGVVCRAAVYCPSSFTHYYLQCLDFFQEAVSESLVLLIFNTEMCSSGWDVALWVMHVSSEDLRCDAQTHVQCIKSL